jgi:hypothetical protein
VGKLQLACGLRDLIKLQIYILKLFGYAHVLAAGAEPTAPPVVSAAAAAVFVFALMTDAVLTNRPETRGRSSAIFLRDLYRTFFGRFARSIFFWRKRCSAALRAADFSSRAGSSAGGHSQRSCGGSLEEAAALLRFAPLDGLPAVLAFSLGLGLDRLADTASRGVGW